MKREILVHGGAVAVMEDGRLCEYLTGSDGNLLPQTVVRGRVARVVRGMDAAFVDIGADRNGFLPLQEKNLTEEAGSAAPLREGDLVTVQIQREAHGEKGAFLTRDITLTGQALVLMPCGRTVGVSGKLDTPVAARLRELGHRLADGRFGLVMRTAAADIAPEAIEAELESLLRVWDTIAREAPVSPAPAVLWTARSPLEALLDDLIPRGVDAVISDEPEVETLCAGRCLFRPVAADPMHTAGVPAKLEEALRRRVWLKSGANLIIDECEALTIIDVNTAKNTGKRQAEASMTRVNVEACAEIARQVRLRSLGGIIIIDMIDMLDDAHRSEVLQALRQAFDRDRARTVIHGFTSLGLIEMTRRRTRKALRETLRRHAGTDQSSP